MQADFAVASNTPNGESQPNIPTSYKIDLQPPPFSDVHDGPEYLNTSVTIELNNNTRVKGKLLQFNAATETIGLL